MQIPEKIIYLLNLSLDETQHQGTEENYKHSLNIFGPNFFALSVISVSTNRIVMFSQIEVSYERILIMLAQSLTTKMVSY
jgi:hypothetical protein